MSSSALPPLQIGDDDDDATLPVPFADRKPHAAVPASRPISASGVELSGSAQDGMARRDPSFTVAESIPVPGPDVAPTPMNTRMVRYRFPEEPPTNTSSVIAARQLDDDVDNAAVADAEALSNHCPAPAADAVGVAAECDPADEQPATGCLDPTRALFCLGVNHPFRAFFIRIIQSKGFFVTMLFIIALNAAMLAVPQPRYTQPDWLTLTLAILEIVFTVCFAIEMLIKIIALGLVMHPGAYLRSFWNIFDSTVTVLAIISLAADLQNVSTLRAVRILRGLRAISHVRQLRALVETLFSAMRPVVTSLLLIVWFMIIVAIASLHLCTPGAMSSRCFDRINGSYVVSKFRANTGCGGMFSCDVNQSCITNRTVYDRFPMTYDTFGESMLVTLKLVNVDNWIDEMNRAGGSCGVSMVFVSILVVLVGGFLLMNIFLAILMSEYTKAMNKQEAQFQAEEEQRAAMEAAEEAERRRQSAVGADMSDIARISEDPSTMSALQLGDENTNLGIELTEVRQFSTPKSTPKSLLSPGMGSSIRLGGSASKYELSATTPTGAGASTTSGGGGAVPTPILAPKKSIKFAPTPAANGIRAMTLRRQQSSMLFRAVSKTYEDDIDMVESLSSASSSDDDLKPVITIREFDDMDNDVVTPLAPRNKGQRSHYGSMFAAAVGDKTRRRVSVAAPAVLAASASNANLNRRKSLQTPPTAPPPLLTNDSIVLVSSVSDAGSQHSLIVQQSGAGYYNGDVGDDDLFVTRSTNDLGTDVIAGTGGDLGAGGDDDNDDQGTADVPPWRLKLQKFCDYFSAFMLLVTLLNVVTMAMDRYGIPDDEANILNWISIVCTGLFLIELMLKTASFGFVRTFSDLFNVFDLLLLITSIIEFVLLSSTKISALRAIRVLRLLRGFRVLRISKRMTGLRVLLTALMPSFVPACFVLLLLIIIVFVYAVLGMQFFSSTDLSAWRFYYDTIWDASIASFIIVTGDNWFDIALTTFYSTGNNYAVFAYFASLFFIGDHIVYNLFGAVIIDHLERAAVMEWEDELMEQSLGFSNGITHPPRLLWPHMEDGDEDDTDEDDTETCDASQTAGVVNEVIPLTAAPAKRANLNASLRKDISGGDEIEQKKKKKPRLTALDGAVISFYKAEVAFHGSPILQGSALGCCGPANAIRRLCAAIAFSTVFHGFTALVVLANCVYIGWHSPVESSPLDGSATFANYAFVGYYGVEIIISIIAKGAFFPHDSVRRFSDGAAFGGLSERDDVLQPAFFRSSGSFFMLFVFAHGVAGVFVPQLRWFDGFRAIRLALIAPSLRRVTTSLVGTLPQIAYSLLLTVVFWSIFAIFGVELFMGAFYRCTDPTVGFEGNCTGFAPPSGVNATTWSTANVTLYNTSLLTPRRWVNADTNFNDYVEAMFSLFVVAVGEQWEQVMYLGIDASAPHYGPQFNNQEYVSLFFILFYFVGRFLTFHLLVGVIITFFLRGKRTREGLMVLSPDERAYILTMRVLDASLFDHDPRPPKSCVRAFLFRVLTVTAQSCCVKASDKKKHRGTGKHVIVVETPIYEILASVLTLGYAVTLALRGTSVISETILDLCYLGMIAYLVLDALIKMVAYSMIDYFLMSDCLRDAFVLTVIGLSFALPDFYVLGKLIILLRTTRFASMMLGDEHAQKLYALVIHSFPTLVNVTAIFCIMFVAFGAIAVHLFGAMDLAPPLDELTNFRTLWNSVFTLFQVMTSEGWMNIARAVAAGDCEACQPEFAFPFFIFFVATAYIVLSQLLAVVVVEYFDQLDDAADRKIVASFADVKTQWRHVTTATSANLTAEKLLRLLKLVPRRLTRLPVGAGGRDLFKLVVDMRIPLSADLHVHFRPFIQALALHAFQLEPHSIRSYATTLHAHMYDPRCFTAAHLLATRVIAMRWREYVAMKRASQQPNQESGTVQEL